MFNPTCCGTNWVCLPVPPTPPPAPIPPAALNGPIRGDITGNAASPGNVGEFVQRSVTGNVTVGASAGVTTTVTPLTLSPGDWDVEASLSVSALFTAASVILNPTVPGMSSNMFTSMFLPGVVHLITTGSLVTQRTQLLSASAASILQFDITINNFGGSSQTGPYTLTVNARRMR